MSARKKSTATTDRQGGLRADMAWGLGEKLYAFALRRMKEAGMKVATVGTGGDEAHGPARRAYEKVGFAAAVPSLYLYKSI